MRLINLFDSRPLLRYHGFMFPMTQFQVSLHRVKTRLLQSPGGLVMAAFGLLILTAAGSSAPAATPTRNPGVFFRSDRGVAQVQGPLPAQLGDENLLAWKTPMDPGHSTPMRWKGRLYLTTYHSENRQLAVVALDEKDGRIAWTRKVNTPQIEPFHALAGSPAASTPAIDEQHVYIFFGSSGLLCLHHNGEVAWEKPMGPFRNEYGASSSPVLTGHQLILLQDHDLGSFLAAYDTQTGRELWKVDRPDAVRSYSTPAVWENQGRTEILVAGALELSAYDPNQGALRWSIPGLARIVIPTPLPWGDRILMASWAPGGDAGRRLNLDPWDVAVTKWDANKNGQLSKKEIDNPEVLDRFFRMDLDQSGELDRLEWEKHAEVFRRAQNAVLSIRPGKGTGRLSEDAILWKHSRGVPYVASPTVHDGIFWMVKEGGILTKLEAETGTLIQEERLSGIGSYYGSPVIGDGKVYCASEAGVVTVLAEGKEWKILGTHDFKEKIHASLVLGDGRVYVRTQKAVYAWGRKP